jgi:DNA polymerase-3 subunit delta
VVDVNIFRDLIKENKLSHLYLFVVQETYDFHKILNEIKARFLPEEFGDFDFDRIEGKDTDLIGIIHTANTTPMAAEKRLVVVSNAEAVSDHSLEEFKKFVNTPNDNCLLLMVANNEIPSKKWAEILLKKNLIVEFKKFDEKNIPGWIINYLRKKGYNISSNAARALADQIGDNLAEIAHQLDKAMIFFKKGDTIDDDAVRDLVLRSRRHKFWELSDAAAEKKLAASLLLLNNMMEDGESEVVLLGVLNNYFRKLSNARYLFDAGLKPEEVCETVGQKWFQRKFMEQVKRFKFRNLERISGFIRQTDENIKTGYLTPRDNLERLLYNICSDYHDFPCATGWF